ncbi:FkbM family methyltransferase [Reyranella sp.]|jgi:hypothetical protein|uniref:FkbM family methyltransferase n=1 Tax=Reyranella sp. TaxID=1929291 RepID=UPI002F923D3A
MSTKFAAFVAGSLRSERFTLVDVGCSGGIDSVWRVFGDRLRAVGFDASVRECERLAGEEANPDVRYIAAFVDVAPDHPFARRSDPQRESTLNFEAQRLYSRSSAAWAMEIRSAHLAAAPLHEQLQHNAWGLTELADPARAVDAARLLEEIGYADVDVLKIDIDGPDFRVLNSFDGLFDKLGLLAARLEVNFYGGAGETLHTFHNTDRFMRGQGYELVALENRVYSMRALPSRFAITMPAQTERGRPFQADASYARDPVRGDMKDLAASLSVEKLGKLAAIYSIWDQPDSAAEILLAFRERMAAMFDIDHALDLLAAQMQDDREDALPYRDYMALFATDSPAFYPPPPKPPPPPPPPVTLRRRLAAARRAFDDPNGAFPPRE